MGNRLACIGTVIDDQPVTGVAQAQLGRNFRCFEQKVPEHLVILGFSFGDARNRPLRDDEDVNWGLGFDVSERNYQVILVLDGRRDLARHDLLEKSLAHAG
jgi:hypothetical protein